MAVSVASTLRSEGGRTIRDQQGFKVSKWQPAARPQRVAQPADHRIIGLTHNYDTGHAAPVEKRPVEVRRRIPDPEIDDDLREHEFVDEETHSRIEHIPVRVQERVVNRIREVPRPVPVPKYIEVPKPYPVEKIVEVPKYIEKRVEVPVEVERVVEVPKPYPVEVIKRVEVPVEVERVVEKIVEVDRPVHHTHRVEVPIREEVVHEVARPVREEVAVPFADPRQTAAIHELQGELNRAHAELERLRGGQRAEVVHRGARHYRHEPRTRRELYEVDAPPLHNLRRERVEREVVTPETYERSAPVGIKGRVAADDMLLNQHPTNKWGRIHDIPGRRAYPADPFYRIHPDRA